MNTVDPPVNDRCKKPKHRFVQALLVVREVDEHGESIEGLGEAVGAVYTLTELDMASAPDKALEESALHLIRTERWASTWHIGCYLRKRGWVFPTRDLRNVLKTLEASGVLRRHVYSTSNNLFWELVPTEGAKP